MPTTENRKAISIGQAVVINPRGDRSRKERVSGVVSEILTKNLSHPHGILVKLDTGEIGRVKDEVIDAAVTKAPTLRQVSRVEKLTIQGLIESDEDHHIEFKTDALWSTQYSNEDIKNHRPQTPELGKYGKAASKIIIAKTLAGFLNTDGGDLIIGYKEGKNGLADEVIGIDVEFEKLKDQSPDGYRRMITELVKTYFPSSIFNLFNAHFKIYFEKIDGKTLCRVNAKQSDKRVFLKLNKKDHFFVRVDASTRELQGEEILEFCDRRF